MIIYKATNKVNGKCYIGQTVRTFKERMNAHHYQMNDGIYFHNALRKHTDDFVWEVIDTTCTTQEELNEMEYHYIKQYHSHRSDSGYNLAEGGSGNSGWKQSEEQKQATSDRMKNWHKSLDIPRKGKNHPSYGTIHTKEQKQKWSDTRKGSDNPNYGNRGKNCQGSKMWRILHPDGKTVEIVIGLVQFCKEHGLLTSSMRGVASGTQKQHKGYKCSLV